MEQSYKAIILMFIYKKRRRKKRGRMPPALFLIFKIELDIWGTNFKIVFSISVKNALGILIRIAWNL